MIRMTIEEAEADDRIIVFKAGNLHTLPVDEPPQVAIRRFYSWTQNYTTEIFGGRMGRPFFVEVWINDPSFTDAIEIDNYLKELDQSAGEHGRFEMDENGNFTEGQVIARENCTFMGFKRKPFDGQRLPTPLVAVGTHNPNYGNMHICGELHFFQLEV